MRSNRTKKWIILLLVVACIGYAGYHVYIDWTGGAKARETMKTLETIIPGLGMETDVATGLGRDPLAVISIDGIDIVGVIEIPSQDVKAPVAGKDITEEYFATWLDGSPVMGQFKIIGGKGDVFRKIEKLKPGDRVIFTDIDGVRYTYEVTTQYHLKKWDEGDNDLQICYESDDKTYFVVGCKGTY